MYNIKKLIISFFLFLIILCPLGDTLAEESTIPSSLLSGPSLVPAGFIVYALQSAKILPETKSIIDIGNPVAYVASGVIIAASDFLSVLSGVLVNMGQGLLGYVIEEDFTGKSVTNFDSESSSYNFVVATGWGIVKNVANAALVIGLVFIAINIILGKEENKAKKTLINFIIIALLINFTPVICGFIIDGSNIVTKSFMSGGINNSFASSLNVAISSSYDAVKADPISVLTSKIIFLIFSLVLFFIYVLYALLFMARYIILWILVIISPIAFATKVFPKSKHIRKIFPSILFWDDWWESFIQWCVIGIPAGLSIYLANMAMSSVVYKSSVAPGSSPEDTVASLVGGLFDYCIPLMILIVGYFMTISAGTDAAKKLSSELTSFGKKGVGFLGNTGSGIIGGSLGAAAAAAAWKLRDPANDPKGKPAPTMTEFMQTGWNSGKKEGIIGETLNTSNKFIGGIAGAGVGAGKWAIRSKKDDPKGKIEEYMKKEASIGMDEGGLKAFSETAGKVIFGAEGVVAGTLLGTKKALEAKGAGKSNEAAFAELKKEIVAAAKEPADIGGTLAYAVIGKATRAAIKGTKEVVDTMAKEVTEGKPEKQMTKKQWKEEEAKNKGEEEKEEKKKP